VVADYVRDHSRPTDSMIVAFGHPDIVEEAGLQSPYEHLWSLSARVRDPRLVELSGMLSSTNGPRWVVVDGASLATWGIDATRAQRLLDRNYVKVALFGDWNIYEQR
jgi:hypothetical protein